LREVLSWGLDAQSYEIKAPAKLLDTAVLGDWLIRKDAPPADRAAALQRILRDECKLHVTIGRRRVADEVIVVTGAARMPAKGVQLYSDRLNRDDDPAYADTGDFGRFLVNLAGLIDRQPINESSTPADAPVTWSSHSSAWVYDMAPKREAAKIDLLLANVAKQTGLTLRRETRQVDRWFVTSDE
jgi:hypothetical protein